MSLFEVNLQAGINVFSKAKQIPTCVSLVPGAKERSRASSHVRQRGRTHSGGRVHLAGVAERERGREGHL